MKNYRLFRDQYGQTVCARTIKELREKSGGGRVSKMYVDKADGSIAHVGYVVGQRWFSMFAPIELVEKAAVNS